MKTKSMKDRLFETLVDIRKVLDFILNETGIDYRVLSRTARTNLLSWEGEKGKNRDQVRQADSEPQGMPWFWMAQR